MMYSASPWASDRGHLPHPNIGHDGNLVYAYLSYAAWGVLYNFTNVPWARWPL